MPSKKPIIHFNTDQWIIDKMKVIADENNRSLAKEMEYLCKQRIKDYEDEHGEIDFDEIKAKQFKSVTDTMYESFYDMILKMAKKTNKTPRELWEQQLNSMSEKKKAKKDFTIIQEYVEQRIAESENE